MQGIRFNGKHSWCDFRAVISKRKIGNPPKKRMEETVPYSNQVFDFSALYGIQVYGERTLQYTFSILGCSRTDVQKKLDRFILWLMEPSGNLPLYDEMMPDSHFEARCTEVSEVTFIGSAAAQLTVTFTAAPYRIPNSTMVGVIRNARYPDINGDGTADAVDASLIQTAASRIGNGSPSGLSPVQELLADVDGDGVISAVDASILLEYAAKCGTGVYTADFQGWMRFVQDHNAKIGVMI